MGLETRNLCPRCPSFRIGLEFATPPWPNTNNTNNNTAATSCQSHEPFACHDRNGADWPRDIGAQMTLVGDRRFEMRGPDHDGYRAPTVGGAHVGPGRNRLNVQSRTGHGRRVRRVLVLPSGVVTMWSWRNQLISPGASIRRPMDVVANWGFTLWKQGGH